MSRSGRFWSIFLAVVFHSTVFIPLAAPQSSLEFSKPVMLSDHEGEILLQSNTAFSFQGFSASLAYDPGALAIKETTIAGTMVEAVGGDFFQANNFPDKGHLVIGVLIDAKPPFTDARIPGIEMPLPLVKIVFEILPGAAGSISLRFVDGLGSPPTRNLFSVDNESRRPDRLIDGVISFSSKTLFIRGDVNQDAGVDVSDSLSILGYLFLLGKEPRCLDAADGNDDEFVDVTDAIFLLQAVFLGSHPIPPPYPAAGADPTRGPRSDLGCREFSQP